jgi:hypothetical protein
MRLVRPICAFPWLMAFLLAPALGQEGGIPQPAAIVIHSTQVSRLPVPVSQFTSGPRDVELLPHGEGARHGRLWIRMANKGLYIAGKVEGDPPDFPRASDQILAKDHVEVWLAGAANRDLPEIGWGNQFDDETLPRAEESCAEWARTNTPNDQGKQEKECRGWAAIQVQYRPYFKRLFLRQWVLAPNLHAETFASPAFAEIQQRFSKLGDTIPEFMQPAGKPQMFLFPEQSGYSFEIVVPFDAFPPLSTLRPDELRILVDVFRSAPPGKKTGAYSTSSATRTYGKAETFNSLRLDPPVSFRLTPCNFPLVGTDKRGESHPAWFLPSAEPHQNVPDSFIVVNDPAGYRYGPAGLSPSVRRTQYFWKTTGSDEWVCGPHLTYEKNGEKESAPDLIAEDGFDVKRLADGSLLVKTGPRVWYSEFGSGQCGACARTDLRIYELGRDMKFYNVLALGDVIDSPQLFSQDFTVSPDWSRIMQFDLAGNKESAPAPWSSTTWCLKPNNKKEEPHAHVYEKCDHKEKVQPPEPPALKELRNQDN